LDQRSESGSERERAIEKRNRKRRRGRGRRILGWRCGRGRV